MRRVSFGILFLSLIFCNVQARRLGVVRNKRQKRQSNELTTHRDRVPNFHDDFPLFACDGHCRSDRDCAVGLKCFQRTALEVVPGCSGLGDSGVSYCYDPEQSERKHSEETPTSADDTVKDNAVLSSPDIATARSLMNTPFSLVSENAIPAPAPVTVTTAPPVSNNLINDDPQLAIVGMNGQPSSAFPLQKCQGHCWGDVDCEAGLVCFKMFEPGPIPGCSGEGEADRGYCFDVADYPPDGQGEGPGFRLKMYWEVGYFWQEESFPRPWCMRCDSYCIVDHCSLEEVSRFEFVAAPIGFQIRIDGTQNCFEHWRDVSLIIQPCDASKPSQWFEGDFQSYRFEIHPYGSYDECISVTHHPKDGEIIYVQDCETLRAYKTSYWNIY